MESRVPTPRTARPARLYAAAYRPLAPSVPLQWVQFLERDSRLPSTQRKGSYDQGVPCRQQIHLLSVFEGRPAWESQTIASLQQLPAQTGHLSLVVSAEVPHVGMVRVVAPSFAQPSVSRLQNPFIEDVVQGDVHPLGILAANPDRSQVGDYLLLFDREPCRPVIVQLQTYRISSEITRSMRI